MDASKDTGPGDFVRLGARDNFYQSCAYIPMSFALVTSVDESGETGIGPHALCFPFSVTEPYAMLLISRPTSGTAANIRRTRRCALNYIEFDAGRLRGVTRLGYPGQSPEDKRKANPFTMRESPVAASRADATFPRIIAEAFQVFECTWDDSMQFDMGPPRPGDPGTGKFVLRVDNILLKPQFRDGVEEGRNFPSMPIFMGFRARGEFWFAEHAKPFNIAAPTVAGTERQAVGYLANRLDETIRFSDAACDRLTRVPRPFLQGALERIIAAARERGVTLVEPAFIDAINRERNNS
jgi:flavin reductase (DIM6/NTAB) family NADH-FMN oxidoreductase RutF